jgi:hypothetical protein
MGKVADTGPAAPFSQTAGEIGVEICIAIQRFLFVEARLLDRRD